MKAGAAGCDDVGGRHAVPAGRRVMKTRLALLFRGPHPWAAFKPLAASAIASVPSG